MDASDRATMEEERQREQALNAARRRPVRDLQAEICTGCNYATKAAWGRSCDGWTECLEDHQRRERAGR